MTKQICFVCGALFVDGVGFVERHYRGCRNGALGENWGIEVDDDYQRPPGEYMVNWGQDDKVTETTGPLEIILDGKDIESIVAEDQYGTRIEWPAITQTYVIDPMWIDENSYYNLSECKIIITIKPRIVE